MNINIQQYLPHREPMQMVDTITSISSTTVVTQFEIKPTCIFVDNQQLTEVGLIENMAQTCSAIVGQFLVNDKPSVGYLSGIKKAQIHLLPTLRQTIRTEAELITRFDTDTFCLCTMKCETYCGKTLLATAEMNLVISIR